MNDAPDDMDFEPEDEFGDLGAAQAKMKKLRAELREAQAKAAENLAGWQRCKADSINARKDALHEAQRAAEREKESFIYDLLPALDAFDMATQGESWDALADEYKSGMGHIHNQLLAVIESHGVKRFGRSGEPFDPRLHEAVQEVDDGDGEPHTVFRILRHGYREGERVIRPAQVIVRK